MKTNKEFRNDALAALKGNWGQAVLAFAIFYIISTVLMGPYGFKYCEFLKNPTSLYIAKQLLYYWSAGIILMMLVCGPLNVGLVNAYKSLLAKGDNELVRAEFKIGFGNWLHNFWGYFLRSLLLMFWLCLLIIPGIVKSLSYAMTSYILVDNPELSAIKAIRLSRDMMKGHKYDLFYLYLGFFGWYLLSLLTLGIGFLWLYPYIQTTQSSFYYEVKAEWEARHSAGITY